jgi:hypothetical protein
MNIDDNAQRFKVFLPVAEVRDTVAVIKLRCLIVIYKLMVVMYPPWQEHYCCMHIVWTPNTPFVLILNVWKLPSCT